MYLQDCRNTLFLLSCGDGGFSTAAGDGDGADSGVGGLSDGEVRGAP